MLKISAQLFAIHNSADPQSLIGQVVTVGLGNYRVRGTGMTEDGRPYVLVQEA